MINKDKIKELISLDNIFELLTIFGGNPTRDKKGVIISDTICHNKPGEGSHKLYYYENEPGNGLFHCYTSGCEEPSFDVFTLVMKVFKIQKGKDINFMSAAYYINSLFHLVSDVPFSFEEIDNKNEFLELLDSLDEEESTMKKVVLKEYDDTLLKHLKTFRILNWEKEGIHYKTLLKYGIKYYPAEDKIIIPHYDINNRLIGIRGRTLIKEEAEKGGKYMPLMTATQAYNHPLGFSLYGLNLNKDNIRRAKTAIVFESEKSVMMLDEALDNNISCACCGSNISKYQIEELLSLGVTEICIAFDRQFKELFDDEYNKWVKKLAKIGDKYKNFVNISIILDTKLLTRYKDSPIDRGIDIFMQLYKERYFV